MVYLGLFGDVHKGNFTWNLKAIDEFQRLVIFAGRVVNRFSFQMSEFVNLVKLQMFPRQIPINQNFTWNLEAIDEFWKYSDGPEIQISFFFLFVERSLSPKCY